MKLSGLVSLISHLDSREHFDIILVQIGANDIIRLTQIDSIERDVEVVFSALSKRTKTLIVLSVGGHWGCSFSPDTRSLCCQKEVTWFEMSIKISHRNTMLSM